MTTINHDTVPVGDKTNRYSAFPYFLTGLAGGFFTIPLFTAAMSIATWFGVVVFWSFWILWTMGLVRIVRRGKCTHLYSIFSGFIYGVPLGGFAMVFLFYWLIFGNWTTGPG